MRITVVSINYAPEKTGIGPYTTGMAVGLARRGHAVEVLTGLPNYPEWRVDPAYRRLSGSAQAVDGVVVRRFSHYVPASPTIRNRLLFEASFGARVVSQHWSEPEVVLTTSPSLLTSAMVITRARTAKIPVGIVVQDLYGKGVVETGAMSGGLAHAAVRFETGVLNGASGIAVVHERFAEAAVKMGVDPRRITVIRNWAHIEPPGVVDRAGVRAKFGWGPHERIILHSGNMGAKQGLENIVEAARLADKRSVDVRFVLLGDGNQRSSLQRLAQGVNRIEFKDPVGDEDYRDILASAEVLLVNERPGVGEMAVPSKLTSYFSAGRPVLGAVDANGVTAQEVRDSQGGIVVSAGDPEALLDAAIGLADDVDSAQRFGSCGQEYAQRLLGPERAIDEYEAWCYRLAGSPADK